MGMFDRIKSELPFPDADAEAVRNTEDWQTKDLDCVMDEYTITASGRLMHDEWHYEEVPKAQRPHPNDDGLMGLAGSLRREVDRPKVDLNFHGVLNFYAMTKDKRWIEYDAKFTDGTLVEFNRRREGAEG